MEDRKSILYKVKSNPHLIGSIKDVDTVGRTVTGFFNTFNYLDSDNDVLLMGSAKKSIKERGPKSNAVAKIKHALNHDLTTLPGKIKVLEEKEIDSVSGIYFETQMANTTLGNDTLINYKEGILDNHSIGFRYMNVELISREAHGNSHVWDKIVGSLINPKELDGKDSFFAVREIALYEGSTVAFGANSLTPFLGVKSGDKDSVCLALYSRMDKLVNALKSGVQSDETMEIFELQILQIKQFISEMFAPVKDAKLEAITPAVEKIILKPQINFNTLAKNFSL